MLTLTDEAEQKLADAQNIWVASVRPDGRPHLAPVWFVYVDGKLYISTEPDSVKNQNLSNNHQVSLALEDGLHPLICEGAAAPLSSPWPPAVLDAFFQKYEWDLNSEQQYNQVIEITPKKWLSW
ncbi:MAG TPA: pyridoxamine 5'-phosphate oxidase family protein [Anaerolineales bacterium]